MPKDEIENVPIEEDEPLDVVPPMLIEELDLSSRAQRCLGELGVATVVDLNTVSLAQLRALPRIGKKTIEEIVMAAEAQGLSLDEGLPSDDAEDSKPATQPVSKPEKKPRKPRQPKQQGAATAPSRVVVDVAVQILSNGNCLRVLRRLDTSDLGEPSAIVKAFLDDCQRDVDGASS